MVRYAKPSGGDPGGFFFAWASHLAKNFLPCLRFLWGVIMDFPVCHDFVVLVVGYGSGLG
jgi:hypothetical protein